MEDYRDYGRSRRGGGIISALAVIVLVLIILKYVFNFDLLGLLNDPRVAPYFDKVYMPAANFWTAHIYPYAMIAWAYIVLGAELVWRFIQVALDKLQGFAGKFYPQFLRPF
ncbi:MAG TPA: hypothetical protein VHF05_02745 [Candidatus Paceibacterota bacterium]|nr:hypothetical protein [Candidatus Paceibacterota bacterium]